MLSAKLMQSGAYQPVRIGASFNGSTYMRRGSIGGASAGNPGQAVLSVWFRIAINNPAGYFLFHKNVGQTGDAYSYYLPGSFCQLESAFSSRATDGVLRSTNDPNDGLWHHLLMGYNGANAYCYVDDVAQTTIQNAFGGTSTKHDWTQNTVGADDNNANKWNGQLAELWWGTDQWLDITQQSNRRKFITADGTPVPLGETGDRPTGTSPRILCSLIGNKDRTTGAITATPSTFANNLGTGGDFTITGTLGNGTEIKVGT